MENQVTNNANALRLFFTEDVFLVEDKSVEIMPLVNPGAVSLAQNILVVAAEEIVIPKEPTPVVSIKVEEITKTYAQEIEIPRVVAEPQAQKVFKFLGGNKKSVLILVNDKQNDVSTEQGRELLRKIVKAVDLGTADFALLNYANHSGTDFVELHQFFKPMIMLSFGVEINTLKLNLTWENEIILHGTTRIIFAPNLHDLDSDLSAKKSLWGNLQKIK